MKILQKMFSFFRGKKKGEKVFYRYLISYFTLLFGVVLMGILLYFHCYELYRQQVEANVESRLEQLGIILDAEMVKISETAQQIFPIRILHPSIWPKSLWKECTFKEN